MSRMLPARCGLAVATALGIGVLVACVSEKGGTTGPVASTLCEVPLSLIQAGHAVVAMREYRFLSDSIRVPVRTTVSWVNCAPTTEDPHTTTSNANVWDSGFMATGDVFSVEFATVGVFAYHCIPHRAIGMTGVIVVE